MKLGTPAKLFLAVLAACAVVLAINGIAGRISFERDFLGYLNDQGMQRMREVAPRVSNAYRQHGGWGFLANGPEAWFQLTRSANLEGTLDLPPPVSDQTGVIPRLALLDAQGKRLIGNPAAVEHAIRLPVTVDGQIVGWLAMVPFERAIAAGDVRFYQAQQRATSINIAASVFVATLLAWLLSRVLMRRVQSLTGGIHRLAAGDYSTRIAWGTDDELGRLAQDVNRLAGVLEHNEQSRRDFMADISHELRTPLAVLRAELEAIQDGIRPARAETLAPLQEQVEQLGKLIDDLYELSVTQAGTPSYHFAPIDVASVLHATVTGMRGRFDDAGLTIRERLPDLPVLVEGEERRLQQLFANLLENALRYTDRGGEAHVQVHVDATSVAIVIEDSAPGVPDDKRSRLFERFYRVEHSRSRASGGSGLGLAICHNIVQAHGGCIHAEASMLGGLRILVQLPRIP